MKKTLLGLLIAFFTTAGLMAETVQYIDGKPEAGGTVTAIFSGKGGHASFKAQSPTAFQAGVNYTLVADSNSGGVVMTCTAGSRLQGLGNQQRQIVGQVLVADFSGVSGTASIVLAPSDVRTYVTLQSYHVHAQLP